MPADRQDRRKAKYRSDGTPIWSRRLISGPGVWVTCIRSKEKQAVGELYDLFESLREDLWPPGTAADDEEPDDDEDNESDLEKIISKEIATLKRPRKEHHFANCQTDTPCVIFISCSPPVDPIKMVMKHLLDVETSGIKRTRFAHRMVPVADTCDANLPQIVSLCKRHVVPAFLSDDSEIHTYKIEIHIRNHNTLNRDEVIQTIAECLPDGRHKVDLSNPELTILVEIFKAVCGLSVVKDYIRFKKFNVVEVYQAQQKEKAEPFDEKSQLQSSRISIA